MATSVSGSSSINGLHSNANKISGLVSGLDTESMIESLVDSYNTKIIGYQQETVKLEWQQEAYRSIINTLNSFSSKYMDLSSSSCLFSDTFFSSATTSVASGSNASAVSVKGTSNSSITVDSVLQTASASTYTSSTLGTYNSSDKVTNESVNLDSDVYTGALSGTMEISYGGSAKVSLSFSSSDVLKDENGDALTEDATAEQKGEALARLINEKMEDKSVTVSGTSYKASDRISASFENGELVFNTVKEGDENSLNITSLSSSMEETLGAVKDDDGNFTIDDDGMGNLNTAEKLADKISGQTINLVYNGLSKSFTLLSQEDFEAASEAEGDEYYDLSYAQAIEKKLAADVAEVFGEKVKLETGPSTKESNELNLEFTLGDTGGTNSLNVTSNFGTMLGFETNTSNTNTINTSSTLGNIFGSEFTFGDEGEDIVINGVTVGSFGADSTLSEVLTAINDSGAGVKASFSSLTNKVVFTSTTTGADEDIEIGGSLGTAMFVGSPETEGNNFSAGTNAVVLATVNGEQVTLERSTNTFDMDGMTLTVNSTFNNTKEDGSAYEFDDITEINREDLDMSSGSVSFSQETDVSEIVDAISEMVKEYNEMMNTIKEAFTTVPLYTSSGSKYMPLTDEDASSMSDSAVESYEEKAKTGLLFGDSNMRNLYSDLSSVFSASSGFGSILAESGFDVTYGSFGSDFISLDTDKLTSALENNMDEVRKAFTSTAASNDYSSCMENMKNTITKHAGVTGSTKGILVNAAGSEDSPLSMLDNTMQTKIDSFAEMIAEWEEKLNDKIDWYSAKFSALEVLMSQANSQSSSLASLGTG